MHHAKHSDLKFSNPRTDQMQRLETKWEEEEDKEEEGLCFFCPLPTGSEIPNFLHCKDQMGWWVA
jgi:hypothetical protein